jgi:hypothetical protein
MAIDCPLPPMLEKQPLVASAGSLEEAAMQ